MFLQVFARGPLIVSDDNKTLTSQSSDRFLEKTCNNKCYCRQKELMASVRKPREKLCASAFHLSKTRKTRTQSGRRGSPLLVPLFREFMRNPGEACSGNGSTLQTIVFLEVFARWRWPLIRSDNNIFLCVLLTKKQSNKKAINYAQ